MSIKQPMLTFAKVVSGTGESTTGAEDLVAISEKFNSSTNISKDFSNKKQEKLLSESNNTNFNRQSENHRMSKNKNFSRDARLSKTNESKINDFSISNVLLEPAPLPVVNAWFKQKSNETQNATFEPALIEDVSEISNVTTDNCKQNDVEKEDNFPLENNVSISTITQSNYNRNYKQSNKRYNENNSGNSLNGVKTWPSTSRENGLTRPSRSTYHNNKSTISTTNNNYSKGVVTSSHNTGNYLSTSINNTANTVENSNYNSYSGNNRYHDPNQPSGSERNQQRGNYFKDNRWNIKNANVSNPQTIYSQNRKHQRSISDWEKVVETSLENNYMNFMENQYQHQFYTAAPPMNTNIRIFDSNFSGNFPNYFQNFPQQMAIAFRSPYVMTTQTMVHPSFVNMQPPLIPVSQIPDSMNSHLISRPDSTTSSALTTTLPLTPTTMLSPNGIFTTIPSHITTGFANAVSQPVVPISFAMYPSTSFVTGPPLTELDINAQIKKQIEYYFSTQNLLKDFFLRQQMASDGFLPIQVVANFPRVKNLTANLGLIAECLKDSEIVELGSDMLTIRAKENPEQWPLTPSTVVSPIISQTGSNQPTNFSSQSSLENNAQITETVSSVKNVFEKLSLTSNFSNLIDKKSDKNAQISVKADDQNLINNIESNSPMVRKKTTNFKETVFNKKAVNSFMESLPPPLPPPQQQRFSLVQEQNIDEWQEVTTKKRQKKGKSLGSNSN